MREGEREGASERMRETWGGREKRNERERVRESEGARERERERERETRAGRERLSDARFERSVVAGGAARSPDGRVTGLFVRSSNPSHQRRITAHLPRPSDFNAVTMPQNPPSGSAGPARPGRTTH